MRLIIVLVYRKSITAQYKFVGILCFFFLWKFPIFGVSRIVNSRGGKDFWRETDLCIRPFRGWRNGKCLISLREHFHGVRAILVYRFRMKLQYRQFVCRSETCWRLWLSIPAREFLKSWLLINRVRFRDNAGSKYGNDALFSRK